MSEIQIPQLTLQRDDASARFFAAAASGQLLILVCASCGNPEPADALSCAQCGATALDEATATGNGRLVTWTVVARAPHPAFADLVPYLVGVVELDEGPWMHARLALASDQAESGLALTATFVPSADGECYPVFTKR